MKPRLYLFLSSLVFVLRIISSAVRKGASGMSQSFQVLKLPKTAGRSVRFQRVLILTPNKENTCSHYVSSRRSFPGKNVQEKVKKTFSLFDGVCIVKTNCVKRIDGYQCLLVRQQLQGRRLQLYTCTQSRSRSPAWQMMHALLSAVAKWLGK